jgi:hypothetical protein
MFKDMPVTELTRWVDKKIIIGKRGPMRRKGTRSR